MKSATSTMIYLLADFITPTPATSGFGINGSWTFSEYLKILSQVRGTSRSP